MEPQTGMEMENLGQQQAFSSNKQNGQWHGKE
jgi:hypothetical protein